MCFGPLVRYTFHFSKWTQLPPVSARLASYFSPSEAAKCGSRYPEFIGVQVQPLHLYKVSLQFYCWSLRHQVSPYVSRDLRFVCSVYTFSSDWWKISWNKVSEITEAPFQLFWVFFVARFSQDQAIHHKMMHIAWWFRTLDESVGLRCDFTYTLTGAHTHTHIFYLTWPFHLSFIHLLNVVFVRCGGGTANESDCPLLTDSLTDADLQVSRRTSGQADRRTEVSWTDGCMDRSELYTWITAS